MSDSKIAKINKKFDSTWNPRSLEGSVNAYLETREKEHSRHKPGSRQELLQRRATAKATDLFIEINELDIELEKRARGEGKGCNPLSFLMRGKER